MQPVHFMELTQLSLSKMVISFLLVLGVAACGTNTATNSSVQSHLSNATSKPADNNISINLNASNITTNIGNLRIQSAAGFQCPNDAAAAGFGVQDQLVFTSDPTTYSQDQIAQIRSYIESSQSANSGSATLPPTLRRVLGGSMDQVPGVESGNGKYYVPCGAALVLTNLGNTSIQIPQVGVQLEERPEQNSYQYRLIDACSLGLQPPCPPVGGAGMTCNIYFASIQLGLGEKGAIYSAVPTGNGGNCGTLTIAPTTQVDLNLFFSVAANSSSNNLIYSIMPVFTVDTAQGKQTLSLPQLVSTVAFASANQFSCYTLQGTAFVPLKSPSAPPNWCI